MHEAYNQSRALAEITHAFQTTVTLSEVADFGGQNDLATQLEINGSTLNLVDGLP
ncbi:hypothetical protein QFK68_08600 [Limosilactobacillus fermentum]|nr:hypothetical protein [Limosilactobacillus fermentum]